MRPGRRGEEGEGATGRREPSPSITILKQALQDKGMRQQDLAVRTGISKDHISRILLGKVAFPKSRDTLTLLASAVGLDPLIFPEYRRSLQVLPESTRRLSAHLKARGLSQQEFIKRIPEYSEGHLQLILRGGTPFPKDPAAIEILAQAADCSPFLFSEYLPMDDWRVRIAQAAEMALPDADRKAFLGLWDGIARHFQERDAGEHQHVDRVIARYLASAFGGAKLADADLDDAAAALPPLERYQPEVRRVLEAMHAQKVDVPTLATAVGTPADELYAVVKGQVELPVGALRLKIFQALGLA